jgi:universal stress protein A
MTIPLHKIICAVDFSITSDSVIRYVAAMHPEHVELIVLYVAPEEGNKQEIIEKHLHDFSRYSDMLSENKVHAFFTVQYGDPAEVILFYAKTQKVDMIVLGSHGTTAIARLLVGSTAETVMRHAPCTVVILKTPDNKNKNHGTT